MKKTIAILYIFLIGISQVTVAQTIESITKAKPFQMSGSLGANLGLYSASGIDERTSPFQYGLSARLTFKFYGLAVPIYASIRDNTFNYGGSFSRLRITPEYKWAKLHLGDTYMNFNPYTLSGRTVRGYGVELTPGQLRFRFLKGKIEDLRSYRDTLELGTVFEPTYARNVTAVALGYGSNNSHIDLYAVAAADRLDSLNGIVIREEYTRQSSTALGASLALAIGRGLSFRSNAGLSLQTDNLDSYGTNAVLGANPLSENLLEANLTSTATYAGDVSLGYNHRLFSLSGKVRYIQPYFQPLTVAFLNTDIINYTIGGSTSFFRRRLNLTGSVGVQRNNLTGSKLSTANNLITNIAANFRLAKGLSGTVNYSNFTQDYEARLVQINDLYTYAITSRVAAASLRYTFRRDGHSYKVGIKGGQNDFLTVDDNAEDIAAYDSWNTALTFGLSQTDQHLSVNTAITYRVYDRATSSMSNYGIRLSGSKGLYENKLRISGNTAFVFNDRDALREGTTWRNGISTSYKLNDVSHLSLRANHIHRSSTVRDDFTEYRMGVDYQHTF